MVQLPAAFSAKLPPAPGFAALLDRRPAFRAFVDRRVRVVPLRVVVPHPAFAAGEFLPRDVARWRKALPAVQACQLIRHEAILLVCFFHFTTLGKVHDYLTLPERAGSFRRARLWKRCCRRCGRWNRLRWRISKFPVHCAVIHRFSGVHGFSFPRWCALDILLFHRIILFCVLQLGFFTRFERRARSELRGSMLHFDIKSP